VRLYKIDEHMENFKSVDEYITSHAGKTKEYLEELRALIHQAAPGSTELINYNIPAFALADGGKREQQIMIAGYKKHVGLYPHPTTMEHFWDQMDGYKKARGSVQFPLNEPLPKELIVKMVQYRLKLIQGE
jgi:uncharacterized protein YdhG (YjbR/CyaY superfamily)